jgi:hypothetical protein
VGLAGNGLDACGFSGGYSPLSIMSWGSNPYSTDVPLQSSILRFGTGGTTDSRRKMLETVDVALSFVPLFYISLQFSSKMDLNFTAQRLGLKANITLPQCRFYDGSEYTDCQGCNISSYTDYNVTYGCYDLSVLCSGASSTRHMARRLANGEGAASYAALAEALAAQLTGTLSINPFAIDLEKAKAILIFVGILIFTFVTGIIYTIPWDKYEHNQLVYLKEGKDSVEEKEKKDAKKEKRSMVDIVDSAFRVPQSMGAYVAKAFKESSKGDGMEVKAFPVDENGNIIEEDEATDEAAKDPWDTENVLSEKMLKENVINFLGIAIPSESVLSNDGMLKRSLRLLISKHEWVDFFTEFNPELSRTIRWIGLWKGLLINLFIDTLFFGVYFADDGTCELFTTQTECLLLPSDLSATGTKCIWSGATDDDGKCSLSPPPSDVMFTVVLALICVLICVPLDFFMSYFLEEMAAKWPDLNSIGCTTAYWYGSHALPEFSKPDFTSTLSLFGKLQSSMSDYERQSLSTLLHDDLRTPEEEVHSILGTIHRIFCSDFEAPGWKADSTSESLSGDKAARANAITENLGVYPSGELAPLSIFRRLRYGTSSNFLLGHVRAVRRQAHEVSNGLRSYEHYEHHFRDYFMIQNFILEHFSAFKRFALRKQLFFYKRIAPDIIPVSQYLLGWLITIGGIMFYFYWVFAWGVKNGGVTMEAWGINFAIGAAQDIFCQNPIKIFVLYVAAVEVMRPQLTNIHRTLYDVSMRVARPSPADYGFRVCQYTSPACRAARTLDAFDLPAARVLRLVNDKDVQVCRQARITRELFIITLLIAIPAVLAVMGDPVADQVLDVLLSTSLSGITLFFNFLNGIGVLIMIIPIVIIVAYFLYRYGLLDNAIKYMSNQSTASDKRKLKHFHASRNFKSSIPWLQRHLRRTWMSCIQWFIFFSHPRDAFDEIVMKKSSKMRRNNVWQRMNIPEFTATANVIEDETGEADEPSSEPNSSKIHKSEFSSRSTNINDSIPEEILSMVPVVLPAYDKVGNLGIVDDMEVYVPRGSKSRHVTLTAAAEVALDKMSEEEVIFVGVKGVTRFANVALKRILMHLINNTNYVNNLLESEEDDMNMSKYRFSHSSAASAFEYVSSSKLEALYSQVWEVFWPGGKQLTPEEMYRVHEYFLTWATAIQEQTRVMSGLVPTRAFVSWFRHLEHHILRMRSVELIPRYEDPNRYRISSQSRGKDAAAEEGSDGGSAASSASSDDEFYDMFMAGVTPLGSQSYENTPRDSPRGSPRASPSSAWARGYTTPMMTGGSQTLSRTWSVPKTVTTNVDDNTTTLDQFYGHATRSGDMNEAREDAKDDVNSNKYGNYYNLSRTHSNQGLSRKGSKSNLRKKKAKSSKQDKPDLSPTERLFVNSLN